ncbi:unnamed protein product [Vicia faba]|uniref:Uncharacterized protein n=1 Tax=Vicia faba TaxID=3906 RepID=A0AAV1AQW6_VICFA|nr:unnamed protein product [Vicia faba]
MSFRGDGSSSQQTSSSLSVNGASPLPAAEKPWPPRIIATTRLSLRLNPLCGFVCFVISNLLRSKLHHRRLIFIFKFIARSPSQPSSSHFCHLGCINNISDLIRRASIQTKLNIQAIDS